MVDLNTRTVGELVMETIRNYGVDTVFGIPGTHNLELYRPLRRLGIRAVTARHEQGAGYAADGWSLQTGRPGVVITTSGPGLLNALSAAGTAYCESRPMLILAPGPALGSEQRDRGTLHETKDQFAAASAIVASARRVRSAADAVEAVHDAFAHFSLGRARPAYVEIPLDVLEARTDAVEPDDLRARRPKERPAPDPGAIADAVRLLSAAEDPVILVGGGARAAGADLRELAERLSAPVVTTFNAKGVLDERHPLSLGANLRLAAARERARSADVLLVVGSKLGDAELWVDRLEAKGTVIRVDILASQLSMNQDSALGIEGDARSVLAAMVALLGDRTAGADRSARVHASVEAVRAAVRAESYALSATNTVLGEAIAAALPDDAIVAMDSSQIVYWGLLNSMRVAAPNSTPYMPTYATLGYALPAAIGARIASAHRPVFAVAGDGALMFSVQELMTAREQGLDLIVLLVENGGYAEIKQNEADAGIPPIAVDLAQPDWSALTIAFGGTPHRAASAAEIAAAVHTALASGGIHLVHIDESAFRETGGAR